MEQEQYKYYAFISFQSADAKAALAMQKSLETYRLPYAVSKKHGLPKRIGPVFCYLTDISLREELMQELEARLRESKYLIVLCSPQSAKSTFVNGGIERFIELGRRDRIIPLIVEGVPYTGDPATECYPEALRRHFPKHADPNLDHQILGVNLNEVGAGSARLRRQRAVVLVMARMLGLNFEDLWRRELKRRRQQRVLLAALFLMVTALVGLTWQMSRSFDQEITLEEQTPLNPALPQLSQTRIALYLEDDLRTDTLVSTTGQLPNLPSKARHGKVRLTAACEGFLPVDTLVNLASPVCVAMQRDAALYGHLEAQLWSERGVGSTTLEIAGHQVQTDAAGRFSIDIPIEEQQRAYPVRCADRWLDSLHAPCGPNDILVLP